MMMPELFAAAETFKCRAITWHMISINNHLMHELFNKFPLYNSF